MWLPSPASASVIVASVSQLMPDMTIVEAARALGYSDDTIRRGVLKGVGPLGSLLRDAGRKSNDGQWIISLTPEQIAQHKRPCVGVSQPEPAVDTVTDAGVGNSLIEELRARIADRDQQIEQIRQDYERTRSDYREERERLLADIVAARHDAVEARRAADRERD